MEGQLYFPPNLLSPVYIYIYICRNLKFICSYSRPGHLRETLSQQKQQLESTGTKLGQAEVLLKNYELAAVKMTHEITTLQERERLLEEKGKDVDQRARDLEAKLTASTDKASALHFNKDRFEHQVSQNTRTFAVPSILVHV